MADTRPMFSTVDPITKLPPAGTVTALEAAVVTPHEEDPTPHTAYDDAPSFAVAFENGLI